VNPHRHDPRDCPTTRCRYCDGTADMWMLGELVVGTIGGVLQALWWLVRHPAALVTLAAAGLVAAAVLGAF
jgi:hypothetical protein